MWEHFAVVVGHEHAVVFLDTRRALGVADVAFQPGRLATPIDILIRFPGVLATARETKRLKAHRLERHVPGQDHEVGPRNFTAILLLDRPEKPPRLVEAHIVRPAIDRGEALLSATAAAATVLNTVGAGTVPRHANEQRAVVAEIRRPPLLRVGHQRREIFLHRCQIEALKFLRVIEVAAHGIGFRGMLMEQLHFQPVRPPVVIGRGAPGGGGVIEWALLFGGCLLTHLWNRKRCSVALIDPIEFRANATEFGTKALVRSYLLGHTPSVSSWSRCLRSSMLLHGRVIVVVCL